jgi:non-homologous end joining protein Ku
MRSYLADADAPARSTSTITLSWGLINMQLSVYTGAESSAVTRKEFVGGDSSRPAGRATIDKSTGEIVDSSLVTRMAEASNGAWVEVSDDEISQVVGVRNVAEILAFVPRTEAFERYVPDGLHQLRPKKNKGAVDPASATAFALFLHALEERKVVALVRLATRGPARYGLVLATGDFLYVHATDEVRKSVPLALPAVDPRMVPQALNLIDAIGIAVPSLPDETAKGVRDLIEAKAAGKPAVVKPIPVSTEEGNIMDTLLASIDAAKVTKNTWAAPSGAAQVA